jgi:hypothetical protein
MRQTLLRIVIALIVSASWTASSVAIAQENIQPSTQIPLVLVLWKNEHFGGAKRELIIDTPNLKDQNFNDSASSVGVHPGPDYATWKSMNGGKEPTVTLFSDIGGQGKSITLSTGIYSNLKSLGMDDSVSSVYFNTSNPQSFAAEGPAAPFPSIPFAIELTDNAGHEAWLVEPTRSISADYGSEFTEVSSMFVVRRTSATSANMIALCLETFYDRCNDLTQKGSPYGGGTIYTFSYGGGFTKAFKYTKYASIQIR